MPRILPEVIRRWLRDRLVSSPAGREATKAGVDQQPGTELEDRTSMRANQVFLELYGRLPDLVRAAVDGLSPEQLARPPAPGANTVGWLIWHLTRVQDDHVAEVAGRPQVWQEGDWAPRFGLDAASSETGYGWSAEQVAALRPESADVLVAYYDAVAERTTAFLATLADADLDRVVDERWDPPVTLAVRLVSVADDDLEHVGQAAYVRGLLRGRHLDGDAGS
jgi:uncharacterized damage-inducible protein DinB